jgi:D-serine deaminase-like pyridoxal phosphate-dependent protein
MQHIRETSLSTDKWLAELTDLPTPTLVLDAARVRCNLERLARYGAQHHLGIRPHTKTHKSRLLASLQLRAGAVGLAMAKVGELEEMAQVGDDLLLAFPALDPARTARLAQLACTRTVRVAIDDVRAVEALASAANAAGSTIGLLVDLDVGLGRTGVATPQDAVALAQVIQRTRGVRLDGLFCYPGHIWAPAAHQGPPLHAVQARLSQTLDLFRNKGLEAKIVSGGSTPTAYQSHLVPAYTEIRPGTYIFNDMNTVYGGYCELEDCAARILCTVISVAVSGQVVLDGGSKTFTSDCCIPNRESGHGLVLGYPEAKITALSEEHAQVNVAACSRRPQLGERIAVVPNHICPCINLQDSVWWLEEDGRVERLTVDARGKLS